MEDDIKEVVIRYISGREESLNKTEASAVLSGLRPEWVKGKKPVRSPLPVPEKKPLNLTPATIRRLEENNPAYEFVEYYNEDGTVGTMTVEQYKKYTDK